MTFYNSRGNPIAYLENKDIYLFNGTPVAYIDRNTVYSFSGKHLGWFENGWIRDLNGDCVFSTENSTGVGPSIPVACVEPVPYVQQLQPEPCVQQVARARSVDTSSWSNLSGEAFFYQ